MSNQNAPVLVPGDEVARQAVDPIKGYLYQLHQTVLAWLNLGEDELLHIELGEDIAVSDNGKLELVQVKRASSSITLRSKSVHKLVQALWSFQKSNPTRTVSAALITTSRISKEKGGLFPGSLPGLHYWRVAAREGGDVKPIRTEMLKWDLTADLREFLKTSSIPEFRKAILRPLHWYEKSASQEVLDRDIEERLIKLGSRMGVAAQGSANALDALVGHILKSLQKAPEQRFVTATELLQVFQQKTFVSVPPGILTGLSSPASADTLTDFQSSVRDLERVPLAPRVAPREDLVASLQRSSAERGILWLHGSSGLGKTTLALLIGRAQRVSWRFADLRDLPSPALRSVLSHLAEHFHPSKVPALILDDVAPEPDNNTVAALGMVARAVSYADGVLIVTSTKPPPPSVSGQLGLLKSDIVHVPYLSELDVGELVSLAGGDPSVWTRNVHAFSGGHPQLVDARIVGLRQRGWDRKEALSPLMPVRGVPNDMEDERKLVRTRLLQDLDAAAVDLLLRLSVLMGYFTRDMAMVAATVPPPVPQPGLQFDFLVGPWIEQVGEDRYRLSPLLSDSGVASGMVLTLRNEIKGQILRHLIVQRPFPADQLLQLFLIAFLLNDKPGLTWFSGVILAGSVGRKKAQFKRLAEAVSVVSAIDRGDGVLLIADDPTLSSMLRFAQLRIAAANGEYEQAGKLVDRALFENSQLTDAGRGYADTSVYSTVLLDPKIPVPAKRWLTMLQQLQESPQTKLMFERPVKAESGILAMPERATQGELLFIFRASSVKDIASLKDLIEALDEMPASFRDRFLGAATRVNNSINAFVSSSWLGEVKKRDFDAHAAAGMYERLEKTDTARGCKELAIELICARAVLLDEYAKDQRAALDLLERAEQDYPTDYRLNRQRQRVYYRHKQYIEALAEFERFQARMPQNRPLERAYAMREAGKSAAELGDTDKARFFFGEAWEASRLCDGPMIVMTAGLSADCAILDYDAGKVESALALMQRALVEADGVNPKSGLRESYIKRILIVAVLYMRGGGADWPVERQARVVGMCSDPDPQDWFRTQPHPQPNFVWYQLAELEAETSSRQDVLAELRSRTVGGGLLPMEVMLSSGIVKAALRDQDVDRFFTALPVHIRSMQQGMRSLKNWGGGDIFHQPLGHLPPISPAEWKDPYIQRHAKVGLLTLLLCIAAKGRRELLEVVRRRVAATVGLDEISAPIFSTINDPVETERDLYVAVASAVGRLLRGDPMDADDAYLTAVYALMLFDNNVLASVAAEPLLAMFEQLWPEILKGRTFSMRAPQINGPLILEAMREGERPLQRLANMVLSAEAAVKRGLSDDLRSQFSKLATPIARRKLWEDIEGAAPT